MGGGRKITINNVFRSFEQKGTMFLGFLLTVLCLLSLSSLSSLLGLLSLSSLLGLLSWGRGRMINCGNKRDKTLNTRDISKDFQKF